MERELRFATQEMVYIVSKAICAPAVIEAHVMLIVGYFIAYIYHSFAYVYNTRAVRHRAFLALRCVAAPDPV